MNDTLTFLAPCERRVGDAAGAICQFLSEEVGLNVGAHPELCAACMLRGAPDPQYLSKHAAGLLRRQMHRVTLGFYTDPGEIERLYAKAHEHMSRVRDGHLNFKAHILEWIEHGRISLARAEELASKHAPELLEDELPRTDESSGGDTPGDDPGPKAAA